MASLFLVKVIAFLFKVIAFRFKVIALSLGGYPSIIGGRAVCVYIYIFFLQVTGNG